jgi:2-enoate reductase
MKLFESGRIGGLTVKNRVVMAAMGPAGLVDPCGRLSKRGMDYYTARAQGGAGLLITGMVRVSREEEQLPGTSCFPHLLADSGISISWLNELAERVHAHGAKIAVQLTAGWGRVIPKDLLKVGKAIAPSVLPCLRDPNVHTRQLTRGEIEKLVKCFEASAEMVYAAGVDAIELHGHEGYLLDQFMTALWNKRVDSYGGDLDRRLQFPVDVIHAIKRGAGTDFPVIYKIGLKHYLKGGREIDEGLEIVRRLEAAGVDALEIDAGCYETWHWSHPPTTQPPGCTVALADKVKKVVKIPVIAVGKLGFPDLAERVLCDGKADFVALGRPLLADPEWPNKVKSGKLEDIRPCIGDHEGCLNRIISKKYLSCTVNPMTGMERDFSIVPATRPKRVLIVGGGPAGMEAAIIAAQRGHNVILYEKNNKLGGNLIPASVPDFKGDYKKLLSYLTNQVNKLNVTIEFGKEATPELIRKMNADVVFIATGATSVIPEIPGLEEKGSVSAIDLLLGKKDAGESVILIGGGLIGCETALYLARRGKKITIVEILESLAGDVETANRMHLLELLTDANVDILTGTKIMKVESGAVLVVDNHHKGSSLKAETVVISMGLKPERTLYEVLKNEMEIYAIGDCVKPRRTIDALWEGFHCGRTV